MSYDGDEGSITPCKKHDDLLMKLDSKVDTIMNRQIEIKAQVERTNGRVSSLENWKSFMLGGLAVIASLLVPMFMTWFGSQLK